MKKLFLITVITLLTNTGHTAPTDIPPTENALSSESLEDQLKAIGHLVPKDLIKNIAYDHLKTDDEFKAAMKYIQGEEWVGMVETLREKPEWVALKKYLKESGLDIDVIIRCVEMFAQNVTVEIEAQDPPPKKSFKKFIIDVEQSLPTVKILTALHEKMSQGTAFQQLFEKLSNNESRKLLEDVLALPEVKRMMDIMAEMGVNLYDMLSLMYTFFGWGEFRGEFKQLK